MQLEKLTDNMHLNPENSGNVLRRDFLVGPCKC